MNTGEKICVKIEHLGSRGEGIARVDDKNLFVPKTAAGDLVEVEVLESKRGHLFGKMRRLIEASPQRTEPSCEHFETCGGCDFQHLPYDEQLDWKMRITKHWIQRSPLAPRVSEDVFDQLAAPNPYGYRHRVRIQVSNGTPGFLAPRSHRFFPIKECPVLVEGFFEAIEEKSKTLKNATNLNLSYVGGKLVENEASYELNSKQISFSAECFTQANLQVNALMADRILEDLGPRGSHAVDLFSGVGNFSLLLKDHFEQVTGVESFEEAHRYAQMNDPEVQWILSESDVYLSTLVSAPDFVLLDPPRSGALRCAKELVRLQPERICYISCQLDSLIKDLTQLVKKGGYQIERWTVADLLPQTKHIESIVSLKKAS